jgi:GMP synthase-like glutamine amidotransferase
MILFIVTDTYANYREERGWHAQRGALEDASQDVCVMLHYTQVTPEVIARLQPWALCHSGGSADYAEYDVLTHPVYQAIVHETNLAQVGFCGGHQILASFFGSQLGPMRRLRAGEPDLSGYSPGYYKEWGVYPVRILAPDPLFASLGEQIHVQEYHYWEVKRLGPDLVRLAETRDCRVQAFRHRARPIYGTQFHPEQSPAAYPDGKQVLANFFDLARRHFEDQAAGRPAVQGRT